MKENSNKELTNFYSQILKWPSQWSNAYYYCVALFGMLWQSWAWIMFVWFWMYVSRKLYNFLMPICLFLWLELLLSDRIAKNYGAYILLALCFIFFVRDSVILFKKYYTKEKKYVAPKKKEVLIRFIIVLLYILLTNLLWTVMNYYFNVDYEQNMEHKSMFGWFLK